MAKAINLNFEERMRIVQTAAKQHEVVMYLDSNNYPDTNGVFNWAILIGATNIFETNAISPDPWKELASFIQNKKSPILGSFLTYDVKNCRENLQSSNEDKTGFPLVACWEPLAIIAEKRDGQGLFYGKYEEFLVPSETLEEKTFHFENISFVPQLTKAEYLLGFDKIQQALQNGDIYEMNYCQHFSSTVAYIDPIELYKKLNTISPAPFSSLLKYKESWLICSSPERFLLKKNNELLSQPIKGTSKRFANEHENNAAMLQLKENPKEINENIMIVDLVRNDLSHFAIKNGVHVLELCKVYTFATVNHMISTIKATVKNESEPTEILAKAFPMGSMTGVPKINALEIADALENFQRRLYSGSIGYFTNSGDFDFNVVIRSLTWNAQNGYISLSAGSAVTIKANGKDEYNECMLKAEALFNSLKN
jgi:para-aminobenzoate synthetase component 1